MKRFLSGVALILTIGCSSGRGRGGEAFPAVDAPSAAAAFERLQNLRSSLDGARSYAQIRIESGGKSRTFKASIALDRMGSLEISGFTPVGTAGFTLFARDGAVTLLDHVHRKFREGPAEGFSEQLALLSVIDPASAARLLIGVPAAESRATPGGETVFEDAAGVVYSVTPGGLSEARVETTRGSLEIRYEPARFPPERLTIDSFDGTRSTRIVIQHLELFASRETIVAPDVPEGYQCCAELATGEE